MKTLLGEIFHCPRCGSKFNEGEEQRCRAEGCNWPWPSEQQLEFIQSDRDPIIEKHWCMCTKLGGVARDGQSTCQKCGGKDAYGLSEDRPEDKRKEMDP